MARGSGSALSGLAKLAEERLQFEAREKHMRSQAAVEIGTALLDVGAETVDLKLLQRIVRKVAEMGGPEAVKRLDAKAA